ncbi:MAG TPA: methyltransferase domain-containing protein [Clostridiaceae bacterium]
MEKSKEIESFYDRYDEWLRLERHKVEFEITKKYIDKYVPANSRILDIGGGPGRYSIYLASKGNKVVLLDLTKKHIEIAKEKALIYKVSLEEFIHGSALELPKYNLGKFDVILLMGPLYHLTKLSDRENVVRDTMALLKPGGILIASFISAYAPFLDIIKSRPEDLNDANQLLKYLENGVNSEEEGFTSAYFIKPLEAKSFMSQFNLKELAFAGVEGLSSIVEQKINELPQNIFEQHIEAIYRLSKDPNTFASCEHYLYVGRKK